MCLLHSETFPCILHTLLNYCSHTSACPLAAHLSQFLTSVQVAAGGGNDQALTLASGGASGGPGAGMAGGALMGAAQALHPGD